MSDTQTHQSRPINCTECGSTTFSVTTKQVFGKETFSFDCTGCKEWRVSCTVKDSVWTQVDFA